MTKKETAAPKRDNLFQGKSKQPGAISTNWHQRICEVWNSSKSRRNCTIELRQSTQSSSQSLTYLGQARGKIVQMTKHHQRTILSIRNNIESPEPTDSMSHTELRNVVQTSGRLREN
ncbi:hypothetical protein L2E82_40519 [Cichorium intybus]|uniref:Uncharacterized protein n=1 Tax=Cichorium intybus TaxID=13427 RepID=A0ACB9AKG4_CICIN|nr:hypothetical protein L2E82_40519 [Cichorium intybus]